MHELEPRLDKINFLRHVPLFHAAGYSTLLIDCREHGTSSRRDLGVGFTTREAMDVVHAARYAREHLGYDRVVACGTSQGAACCIVAAVLADEVELASDSAAAKARPSTPSSKTRRNSARDGAGEDEPFLESPRGDTPVTPNSTAAKPKHLIDAVIAENAFLSREACVGDVIGRVLGRVPSWAKPLKVMKSVFVTGAILALRWRLGLFSLTKVSEWRRNWQRAQCSTEHALDSKGSLKPSSSSPSASLLPLPPLSSPSSPLYGLQIQDFNAMDLVDRIAPRPLLLMHGLADDVVKPIHSQLLYAKARDPKKLWSARTPCMCALGSVEEKST
jgi:pimeloyl-ACP methyl ester carboxylesterase